VVGEHPDRFELRVVEQVPFGDHHHGNTTRPNAVTPQSVIGITTSGT
jgi:hypothetical protein